MDESINCECGNDKLWWFGECLRCPNCYNEFKVSGRKNKRKFWLRRFNNKEHRYGNNWEKFNQHTTAAIRN